MVVLRSIVVWLLAACVVSGAPSLAHGQTAPVPDAGAQGYPASYFAPFNPVTAEDMVRRTPGFTLSDGQDRRGFAASAGNVLINGDRPSSKVLISEQLSRISARDVERIDVIAGGGAADAGGHALIVDVRLRPRQKGATNTFVLQAGLLEPGWTVNPIAIASSAFRLGQADISLSLQAQPARRGRIEYEKVTTDPSGAPRELGPEYLQGTYYEYKLNGRATWRPTPRDTLNASLQVTPTREGRHTYSEVFSPGGARIRIEDSLVRGDPALALEMGGDWERQLSSRTSVKLLALATQRDKGSDERYTTLPTTGLGRSTFIRRESESGEYIGRAIWSFSPKSGRNLEAGAEVAFNFLESGLDIDVDVGRGRQPTVLPVANTKVEEVRGEVFLTQTSNPTAQLRIEKGVVVETSRITQSGDANQERSFTFVKPRLVATWTPSPREQVRLRLERDVAQLDFNEFASAVSLFDGTVDLGNPNLEPERTWRAQLDWERRFGAKAVLTLSAFYERVEAVQDQIPVRSQFDAPGNLGDGWRAGGRIDALLPLDSFGLPRGELRLRGLAQDTRVDDPLTGQPRRFAGETHWRYSIDLRQPLPNQNLAWGALWERADEVEVFRVREQRSTEWDRGNLDLYVETTAIRGLVIRLTAADILLPEEVRERRFFLPDRSQPTHLSGLETRRAIGGFGTRSYTLRISGRF